MPSVGDPKVSKGERRGSRVSSGYNRRRRLATRSSGKQQAERTAVRTAPIVCPEGKPFGAPAGAYTCIGTPTPRRGCRGASGKPPCLHEEERQLCRKKFPLGGGLTRRLRRGWWGCRPEGGSTFFRSERKYQRKPAARRLQRRPAPLRVIRKYRRSGHCRARLLYLLRPASR